MGEGIVPLADGYTVPEGMWKLSLFVGWPKSSTYGGLEVMSVFTAVMLLGSVWLHHFVTAVLLVDAVF